MGYQNNTFPITVNGCIDTCSRKLLWVKVWMANNDPNIIGRFYLEHLFNSRVMASIIKVDKGTETVMTTMHAYLHQQHEDNMDPIETVVYGPSTSNQVGLSIKCKNILTFSLATSDCLANQCLLYIMWIALPGSSIWLPLFTKVLWNRRLKGGGESCMKY